MTYLVRGPCVLAVWLLQSLTFRMSGPGQIVCYGFLVLFSPVVAQICAMSSIARYFAGPGGPF